MAKKKYIKRTKKQASSSKPKADCKNKLDTIKLKDTPEVTNVATQSSFMKTCRLCEIQDGPFVDMFDAEKTLAKKIDEIMPFVITENDDLPRKVCFRCSAKVEEVYEFVQRCVKTQESLYKALKGNGMMKKKYRLIWEDKLNQSNISNYDICNALIQKAIENIKNMPVTSVKEENADAIQNTVKSNEKVITDNRDTKQSRMSPDLRNHDKHNEIGQSEEKPTLVKASEAITTNTFSLDNDSSNVTSKEVTKPFDIMDHVSKIKVNGVGDLFQCKLCNRNFLVKAVVLNHRCAKNGGIKIAEEEKPIVPVPPKIPVIKYINTIPQNATDNSATQVPKSHINIDDDRNDKNLQPPKAKRRIGPASKVRQLAPAPAPARIPIASKGNLIQQIAPATSMPTSVPVTLPFSTNSKFSLVLQPDNSFMLVEDKSEQKSAYEPVSNNIVTLDKINNLQSLTVKSVAKLNSPAEKRPANVNQPYPVHLIKSGVADNLLSSPVPQVPPPAKQLYSVIQTGNPSKLLISTKAQPKEVLAKSVTQMRENSSVSVSENPNNQFISLGNVNPAEQFFYVLPSRNVIQESQISTSSLKNLIGNKYSCNICGIGFDAENKLLSHIQSHYNQIDDEDKRRGGTKKRKYKHRA